MPIKKVGYLSSIFSNNSITWYDLNYVWTYNSNMGSLSTDNRIESQLNTSGTEYNYLVIG